jgi:CSLREA domain-containing protein
VSRAAATFTVNSLADTPDAAPGNGICADAGGLCTLRAALQEANAFAGDDTINFSVTGTINLTGALPTISSNINMNGPGSASLTVRRDTGGDYRIFFTDNRTVSISGMTITNGKTPDGAASSGQEGGSGGGIRQAGGELTLNNDINTGNRTGNGGTSVNNNPGGRGGSGGGIDGSGVLTITNSQIINNATGNGAQGFSGGSAGVGGGLFFGGSTLTMTNVDVNSNTTGNAGTSTGPGFGGNGGDGGGIYILQLTNMARLSGVNINNNTAGNGDEGGDGGGMLLVSGQMTMTDCNVKNNSTGQAGTIFGGQGGFGGGILSIGQITMSNCLISGNSTKATALNNGSNGGHGGGIYTTNVMTITNSTISGNQASSQGGRGGGIYNNANALTLTNVTITGNSAYTCCSFENGQGIHNENVTNVRNTIIAGNNSGVSTVPDVTGIFNSQGHNLIGKATAGGDGSNGDQQGFTDGVNGDKVGTLASPIDPVLGVLGDNGGPTATHKPLAGSPALDAGDNALAKDANGNTLTRDQRGAGRFANSAGPGTGTVDIGAFEFHPVLEDITDKSTNQNKALAISFSVGDPVNDITLTATSDNQTLLPNANILVSGVGTVRTLLMTPATNQVGSTLITVTVFSAGSPVATDTFTLTVNAVNQRPSFTPGPNQTTNEDSGAQSVPNWATNISAGPLNEAGQTLTFMVTGNTNPTLFSAAPAISSSGTLTYTPAANAFGTATIDVVLKDDGGTGNGGQDTSTPASFTITVNAVNDAPTFTKGPDQTIDEDAGFQFISNWATNITTGAPNEFQALQFNVTNNSNPGLFSSQPSIGTSGSLSYSPALNASGSATITIALKDFGGTTNGGQDTSPEQTFTITVNAVNDAPVNLFPQFPSPTTFPDTPLVFSPPSNVITVNDVDAGNDALTVTLTATSGTISLSGTTGLTFSAGDGTDDITVTFSGTLANLNAALNGATFKPASGFTGVASLQISTNDQGHNGSGGAKTATNTISINVQSGGVIQFSSSAYSVDEGSAFAVITLTRTGGSAGSTSVNFSSANGTATGGNACGAGIDFVFFSGTLSWSNNDASTKSFAVPLCADSLNEGDETVNLTLSNITGSAALGTRTTATLTITNDDPPVLLLEEGSDLAITLDSVTMVRDPFTLLNSFNLGGTDKRRRVSLFVWRLGLLQTDTAANVSALAEDSVGTPYPLVVESISPVTATGLTDVTQVVVKLPDNVLGLPRDLFVKVTLRGPSSNRGRIRIAVP